MSPYPKLHERNLCELYCIVSKSVQILNAMSGSRPQFIHLTAISSRIHLYSCFIFISISNRLINLKLSTLFFISKVLVKDTLLKGIPNWGLHSLKSLTYFTALSTQVYHHLQQLPTYLSWIVLPGLLGNKLYFLPDQELLILSFIE